jgi:hypothetical protein
MIKQKGSISIFIDPDGDKMINGRFYDFEYILSADSPEEDAKDRLIVYIDISFNSITGKDK